MHAFNFECLPLLALTHQIYNSEPIAAMLAATKSIQAMLVKSGTFIKWTFLVKYYRINHIWETICRLNVNQKTTNTLLEIFCEIFHGSLDEEKNGYVAICAVVKSWTHAWSHRSGISARSRGNRDQPGLSYRLHYRETWSSPSAGDAQSIQYWAISSY